jgi:hypothetical protein
MSKVIKLPSGNTATWKDRIDYTLKDRKYVLRDVRQDELDNIVNMMDVLEKVVVVSVTDWSFELLPPHVKAESLESPSISLPDIDRLLSEARDSLVSLMPNLTTADDGEVADPKATKPDSNA